jgi:phosphatidylglycerophosphatase A
MNIKRMLYTGFYTGYSPHAPGTAGTFLAMVIYVILNLLTPEYAVWINAALVIVLLYPSVKLGDEAEKHFSEKDPQKVVLDEMMGYWISVMFHPFTWWGSIAAFFIFRIMDIVKPWPADKLQDLKGGMGIMIDDWIAGLYTNLILSSVYLYLIFSK